jgi:hypothetical protein
LKEENIPTIKSREISQKRSAPLEECNNLWKKRKDEVPLKSNTLTEVQLERIRRNKELAMERLKMKQSNSAVIGGKLEEPATVW